MSFTRNIALAGTFAFALLVSSAAPAESTRLNSAVATASAAVAVPQALVASSAAVVRLTPADMTAVQGDGLWNWIKKTVRKIDRWVHNNIGWIRRVIEFIEDILHEVRGTTAAADDQNDHFENQVAENVYYNSEDDFNSGVASGGTDRSESGFVFQYTSYSGGGGGGSTCIDMSQPGCEAMY
jgi:hypothetical protein